MTREKEHNPLKQAVLAIAQTGVLDPAAIVEELQGSYGFKGVNQRQVGSYIGHLRRTGDLPHRPPSMPRLKKSPSKIQYSAEVVERIKVLLGTLERPRMTLAEVHAQIGTDILGGYEFFVKFCKKLQIYSIVTSRQSIAERRAGLRTASPQPTPAWNDLPPETACQWHPPAPGVYCPFDKLPGKNNIYCLGHWAEGRNIRSSTELAQNAAAAIKKCTEWEAAAVKAYTEALTPPKPTRSKNKNPTSTT